MAGLTICRMSRGFLPWRDGLSHHAYYLSREQIRRGHRVLALVTQLESQELDGFNVTQIRLGRWVPDTRRRFGLWVYAKLASRRIGQLHATERLDVIHCHGDAYEAFLAGLAARRLRLPLVVTLHAQLSTRRIYRQLAPALFRSTARFIAVSEPIARSLTALGIDPGKISVISSGINYAAFSVPLDDRSRLRARLGLVEGDKLLLSIGRLHPLKGFSYLLDAARLVPADVQVRIIGDGDLRPALERQASTLPNVRILPGVAHAEVAQLMRAADIFALPSVDLGTQAEGTPTVLMEAMAAGLPIVVSDSGGGGLLVTHGEGGLVVPQAEAPALAAAIRQLAGDPQRRRVMGERNRERARSRDWSVIASQIEEVYARAQADVEPG